MLSELFFIGPKDCLMKDYKILILSGFLFYSFAWANNDIKIEFLAPNTIYILEGSSVDIKIKRLNQSSQSAFTAKFLAHPFQGSNASRSDYKVFEIKASGNTELKESKTDNGVSFFSVDFGRGETERLLKIVSVDNRTVDLEKWIYIRPVDQEVTENSNNTFSEMNFDKIIEKEPNFLLLKIRDDEDPDSKYKTVNISSNKRCSKTLCQIKLSWTNRYNYDARVSRRKLGDDKWSEEVIIPKVQINSTMSFIDRSVPLLDDSLIVGDSYEYRIQINGPDAKGFPSQNIAKGYVVINPLEKTLPYRGTLLIVHDYKVSSLLRNEFINFVQNLRNDGYKVRSLAYRNGTHIDLKNRIKNIKEQEPDLNTLILFGAIPVPYGYSGEVPPDNHSNAKDSHKGAWVADNYYADLDGDWTDRSVNETNTRFRDHHLAGSGWLNNIPNDSKFDQTYNPSSLELSLGRIDFSNLPIFGDEIALYKRYLDKNHAYRTGQWSIENKAIYIQKGIDFTSAWRSFIPIWGLENIEHYNQLDHDSDSTIFNPEKSYYFMSAEAPSFYNLVGNQHKIASSEDYSTKSSNVVFNMTFGSYHGNWNTTNNILRSIIASSGKTLTSMWGAGGVNRGPRYYHIMGAGYSIGESHRLLMNSTDLYDRSRSGVHETILGDPSLRLFPVRPISNFTLKENNDGVLVEWGEADMSDNIYYEIYKGPSSFPSKDLVYLGRTIDDSSTSFNDPKVDYNNPYYFVRAIKRISNKSGSYWEPSLYLVKKLGN